MKFLLLPGNNSLSHIAKCLALKTTLEKKGHEVVVTASRANASFLKHLGCTYELLPDIQEADFAPLPTVHWFNRPQRIEACIRSELNLIERQKPDRVVGVFHFTGKASSRLAGVPYDSLICGCMIPESKEVLGYAPNEKGWERQKTYLTLFYKFAAKRISDVLRRFSLPPIDDIRWMLKGKNTFLWDFPEFFPVPRQPDLIHVGPVIWDHWAECFAERTRMNGRGKRVAMVSFGTGKVTMEPVVRLVKILLHMGWNVLLVAGGQKHLCALPDLPGLYKCMFAPLKAVLPKVSLTICHGGQLTVFESLMNSVPVLVMPFQPEQLHNGLCLERVGCGSRLIAPEPFNGNTDVYRDALRRMSDSDVMAKIEKTTGDPIVMENLGNISKTIKKYDGANTVARNMMR